jgi:signal transduction histidine kinase
MAEASTAGLTYAGSMVLLARWRASRSRAAARATADERRRLAREIHDGLAQELAFISLHARRLARQGIDAADELAGAAERALAESRDLITRLRSPAPEDLSAEITDTAQALVGRHGAALSLDVDPAFRADPETGGHLLRILGEAMSNSLVHGRARTVAVELSAGTRRVLRITDDGIGFEPEADRPRKHFGLESMRERAREIGGELVLRSRRDAGTQVEVVLP